MYEIISAKKFKSAYKKLLKSGRFDQGEFKNIIELLKKDGSLPPKYRDHVLKGDMQEKRECHISSDLLLIYEIHLHLKVIVFTDIGTHSKIFDR